MSEVKSKKRSSIFLIVLCAAGIFLGILALNTFHVNQTVPLITSECNISGLFNCDAEAKSRFSRLFTVPIAFFFNPIYLFGIIIFVIAFFKDEEKRKLVIFGFHFLSFLASVLSLFVFFSMLFLEKNMGVFYPLMMIINLILTLTLYSQNRLYLKNVIFDNEKFKVYKKESRFYFNALIGLIILIPVIGLGFLSNSVIRKNVLSQYSGIEGRETFLQNRKKKIIQNFIESSPENIDLTGLPYYGSDSPEAVKVVEFTDFLCPYCRDFAVILENYVKRYPQKIRIYPVLTRFDLNQCVGSALNTGCLSLYGGYYAQKNGKFTEYYKALFLRQGDSRSHVKQALARAGLNPALLETLPSQPEAIKWVKRNLQLRQKMGVTGTPTIFINGRRLDGMVSLEIFTELIERSQNLSGR